MLKVKKITDVAVDFPTKNECITSPTYTFRIGAKDAEQVEVSINGSLWQSCRQAEGYWWYDWQGYLPGRHRLVARSLRNGENLTAETRRFRVEFGKYIFPSPETITAKTNAYHEAEADEYQDLGGRD